jgi:hypothetical protein
VDRQACRRSSVQELKDLGLVKVAAAEVRVNGEPPRFKLYVIKVFHVLRLHDDTFVGRP